MKNVDKKIVFKWIGHNDCRVRLAAIEACNGDEDIIQKGIEDSNYDVRIAAIKACNGDKDIIRKGIEDSDWRVRVAAIEACNGDKEVIRKGMEDSDWRVRAVAIEACNGDKDIIQSLIDKNDPLFRSFEPPKKVYKKCIGDVIVVAEIPEDAFIRGGYSTKCRTNKAKIIDILGDICGEKVGISSYDDKVWYRIGDEIVIEDFDFSNEECAPGFHFFCSEEMARKYVY